MSPCDVCNAEEATRTWWSLFGAAVATLCMFAAYAVDIVAQGPVPSTPLVLAVTLAVGQYLLLRRTGLTALHWAVYVAVAASAGGPVLGLGTGTNMLTYALVTGGLPLIVLGALDHVRPVRFMGIGDEPQGRLQQGVRQSDPTDQTAHHHSWKAGAQQALGAAGSPPPPR